MSGQAFVHIQHRRVYRVLIFGGQDTTSSTLSRILFELSRREQVQEQVRQEIMTALGERRDSGDFSGRLDYDMLLSLPWLDAVVKESLRLLVDEFFNNLNIALLNFFILGIPLYHLSAERTCYPIFTQ